MDFTIEFNSGGNHGHQLKDALGGLTIGHLFNLNYVHRPYPYLDFFGIGHKYPTLKKWHHIFKYTEIKRVSGPFWNGFDDYDKMLDYFTQELYNTESRTLIIFDRALRIHPFQTIPWYKAGKLKYNIFSKIQQEVSNNFAAIHTLDLINLKSKIEVAIHIARGKNFDKEKYPKLFTNPEVVRYMFDLDYYENIMGQIEKVYGIDNVKFKIYTEQLNSIEISTRFDSKRNTKVFIGENKEKKNYNLIYSIFKSFVEADILVCSNSSFSVICSYFRKERKTIYHPHLHLKYLPEPNFIKTNDNGDFNVQLLQKK